MNDTSVIVNDMEKTERRATILVVTYNNREEIGDCLSGLLDCMDDDDEIILIDNASGDGTVDFVQTDFADSVSLIANTRNLGFAAAINQGAKRARGRYLLFVNPDAQAHSGFVDGMVSLFESDPTIGVAGSKIYESDGITIQHAGGILRGNCLSDHIGRDQRDEGQFDRQADVTYVSGAGFGVRRELFVKLGLLDEGFFPAYFEETDFCMRVRKAGYRIVYNPVSKLTHQECSSSGKFSESFLYFYHRNRLRFALKNLSFWRLLTVFLPQETLWALRHMPSRDRWPLLKAYGINAILLFRTLSARWRD